MTELFGGNPWGWEEGHRGFGLLWSGPTFLYHPRGLDFLCTSGVMVHMKMVQEWQGHQHSNASTPLASHSQTHCSEVSVEVGIQKDTQWWDLCYVTVHFMVRTVPKRLNKEKSWYKKVTLTTISICRSTEDVLRCNPILGFQVSKGVWGCKYGSDWWFLWLRRKLLWLWQNITFLLITSMLSKGVFFRNLSLASEK